MCFNVVHMYMWIWLLTRTDKHMQYFAFNNNFITALLSIVHQNNSEQNVIIAIQHACTLPQFSQQNV